MRDGPVRLGRANAPTRFTHNAHYINISLSNETHKSSQYPNTFTESHKLIQIILLYDNPEEESKTKYFPM